MLSFCVNLISKGFCLLGTWQGVTKSGAFRALSRGPNLRSSRLVHFGTNWENCEGNVLWVDDNANKFIERITAEQGIGYFKRPGRCCEVHTDVMMLSS